MRGLVVSGQLRSAGTLVRKGGSEVTGSKIEISSSWQVSYRENGGVAM